MALLSIPYTFSPNTTALSAQVNENFTYVQSAVNSIDNTNIGGAGIFASQIIPLSTGEATFGGTYAYTFPTQVSAPSIVATGSGSLFYNVSIGAFPQAGQSGVISDGTNGYLCTPGHWSVVNANNSSYVSIQASAFTVESDERAKTNIRPLDWGLNAVMEMGARSYTRLADGAPSFGFVAQELQRIVPEVVVSMKEDRLGVDYNALVPILVNAIQQQQAMIDALWAKLDGAQA